MRLNNKFTYIIIFISLYFIARLPFLVSPLQVEEGTHAYLLCCNPPAPTYLWQGRINGNDIFGVPLHPALIYETLMLYGQIWKHAIETFREYPLATIFLIRLAFSVFQCTIFSLLFTVVLNDPNKASRSKTGIWVLCSLAVSQISIATSLSVQVDGSVGSLLPGLLAAGLLMYRQKFISNTWAFLFLFISSVFLGFGKNEWGLALAASIILIIVLLSTMAAFQKIIVGQPYLGFCVTILLGLILGNIINYYFDPKNYIEGVRLMIGLSDASASKNFSWVLIKRLQYLYLHILLILVTGIGVIKSGKNVDTVLLVLFVWGCALFFPYYLTNWGGLTIQRYYAPSLVVLLVGGLVSLIHYLDGNLIYLSRLFIIVSLISAIVNYGANIYKFHEYAELFSTEYSSYVPVLLSENCIPRLNDGQAFIENNQDFLVKSIGLSEAESIVKQNGRILCDQ